MITQGREIIGFGFLAAIENYCNANDIVFLNALLPGANEYNSAKVEQLTENQYTLIVAFQVNAVPVKSQLDKLNYSGSFIFGQKFTDTDSCDISELYQEKYNKRFKPLMQEVWNILRDWQNMACSKEFPRHSIDNFQADFVVNKTDQVIDMVQCECSFTVDAY